MYFKPSKGILADVIPYFRGGKYHLFYLWDAKEENELCVRWRKLVSEDLGTFRDCGVMLDSGGSKAADRYVFTGSVIEKDGSCYIFYTGHNPDFHYNECGVPQQIILRAKSRDFEHWTKDNFCLTAPDGYDKDEFRDPFVYWDEKAGKYVMLIAARHETGGPERQRGCILRAESDDLERWAFQGPFFDPGLYHMIECPDYFVMNGTHYLIFSEFTDKYSTRYVMSRDGTHWIRPLHDRLDNRCFYAAKSVQGNGGRFIFGWIPTKRGGDCGCYEWGGNLVVNELVARADGTLYLKQVNERPGGETPVAASFRRGDFGYGVLAEESSSVHVSGTIELNDGVDEFGFWVRSDPLLGSGYRIRVEKEFNRITLAGTEGPASVRAESEVYYDFKTGSVPFDLYLVGDILQLYLGESVMSARVCDLKDGGVYLYSNGGTLNASACVKNIREETESE